MKNKKLYSCLTLIGLYLLSISAQTPNSISYQAVVRIGDENTLLANTTIGVQISILQSSEKGNLVYSEIHTPTTNENGLLTLSIGNGTIQSGSYTNIDWSMGPYFVKTEIDPEGGSDYILSSTTQLLTVPYALHAKTAETISGTISFNKIVNVPVGLTGDYNDLSNKPELFNKDYNDLTNRPALATVATSGSYKDLTDKPDIIENGISGDYNNLSNKPNIKDSILNYRFSGNYEDLVNTPELFSGIYNDLKNKPTIATVASTGSYNDLLDKPIFGENGFTGSYYDLSNKPNIKDSIYVYGFSGDYNHLQNKPLLFSGSYNDLSDMPSFFEGSYTDLSDQPSFPDSISTYGFNGNYNSLINTPNIKDTISKYSFDKDYNNLINTPEIPSMNQIVDSIKSNSFSGNYNDLEGKPEGNSSGDILYWNAIGKHWDKLPIGNAGQILSVSSTGGLVWINNKNASTYTIGEIYFENDEPLGIVISVNPDDQNGTLLSFHEFNDLSWQNIETLAKDTLMNCSSSKDGMLNTKEVRRSGVLNNFPAFDTCVALGSDWYLPSKKELQYLANNKDELNELIASLGNSDILGDKTYWSSTERTSSKALMVSFYDYPGVLAGDSIEILKSTSASVRPMKKLNWTQITSRPEDYHLYKVGDIYYDSNNQAIGIVFEVTNAGLHGKVISLEEERTHWCSDSAYFEKDGEYELTSCLVFHNATGLANGQANIDTLTTYYHNKNISNFAVGFGIFWPSVSIGEDWYLPAIDEMHTIFSKMDLINAGLNEVGAILLGNTSNSQNPNAIYWTSTEEDEMHALGIQFISGDGQNAGDTLLIDKTINYFLRGVRNF